MLEKSLSVKKQFSELNDIRKLYKKLRTPKGLGLQKCELDIYKNYRARWSKKIKN